MSDMDCNWVEPYKAIFPLADAWKIPSTVAEDIIRHMMRSGKVPTRGIPAGSVAPRFIRNEEFDNLGCPPSLLVHGFRDVEIEWHSLLEHGRSLIPSAYLAQTEPPKRPMPSSSAQNRQKARDRKHKCRRIGHILNTRTPLVRGRS